jgi:hypothetical protein
MSSHMLCRFRLFWVSNSYKSHGSHVVHQQAKAPAAKPPGFLPREQLVKLRPGRVTCNTMFMCA